MSYSTEQKIEFINGFKTYEGTLENYVALHNISKTSYYNWLAKYDKTLVEIPLETTNASNNNRLKLNIKDISIDISNDYDESLLISVIRSLRKL